MKAIIKKLMSWGVVIIIIYMAAGCADFQRAPAIKLSTSMTKSDVRRIMGDPGDISRRGRYEAWQYFSLGAFADVYTIVWFDGENVLGINTYRKEEAGLTANFSPVDWSLMPSKTSSSSVQPKYYDSSKPSGAYIDKSPPTIRITEPQINRGINVVTKLRSIWVRGKATDKSGISEVFINKASAYIWGDGNFKAEVFLNTGENIINVVATDNVGNTGHETFIIVYKGDVTPMTSQILGPKIAGRYYTLLIAFQNYRDHAIQDLEHPKDDTMALKNVLTNHYQFEQKDIILLINPDRQTIIDTFEALSKKVTEKENLLIFYAGHGYWDQKFNQGYWFFSNASKQNRVEWISNSTIRDFIRGIQSKHTLLISDACFSGGIFKSRKAFSQSFRAFKELYKLPSRKAITSGSLNEVPDKSIFMEYLIKRLEQNVEPYLSSEQLFTSFREAVINNSPISQIPQFGEIREAGDEGGDFIFVRRE